MSASYLAIVAALIFAWGTMSARLEMRLSGVGSALTTAPGNPAGTGSVYGHEHLARPADRRALAPTDAVLGAGMMVNQAVLGRGSGG